MNAAESILALLVTSDLKTALLIGVVFALLALGKRFAASTRHLIWLNVVIASLALPLLAVILPTLPLPLLDATTPVNVPHDAFGDAAVADRPVLDWTVPLALSGYVLGAALLLASLLRTLRALRRLEGRAQPILSGPLFQRCERLRQMSGIGRPVLLLLSNEIAAPATWGFLSPRVALPAAAADWSDPTLDRALLHELAHVRRLDWPTTVLTRSVCALHWYNPGLWFAARCLSLEAEKSCDDVVLDGGSQPSDYAGQLVSLAAMRQPEVHASAGIGLGESELSARVLAILDPDKRRSISMPTQKPLIIATVLSTACALAACQVTAATEARGDIASVPVPAAPPPDPAPVASAAPAPPAARPVAPADDPEMQAKRREMEAHARRVEEQRRTMRRDIDRQHTELRRMEQQLDLERAELERQFEQSRKQLSRAREAIDQERRQLQMEREMLEQERQQRENELQRLEQEQDDA